jgi:polyhydroxyalkanoate depolymerase
MLYESFQALTDIGMPMRVAATATSQAIYGSWPGSMGNDLVRKMVAFNELLALAGLTHVRPDFGVTAVKVGAEEWPVAEEAVYTSPFATLLKFSKTGHAPQPRVLLVAPLSGHFATLLRATLRTLLTDHDVYITDWHNPRDVPLADGRFGLDEYVLHLVKFLEVMGPGSHVVAVCQPTVAALAAVSLMAEDAHPAQPRSMTLMAGPIDTRINPTAVNALASSKPIEWFEKHLIGTVPTRYAGAKRRVYPGFVQLSAFVSMNRDRHINAFIDFFNNRVRGDDEKAEVTKKFYKEYFATMDLPAEFYLETVRTVFQEHALPKGELAVGGRIVNPKAIRRTALLTIEGEKDDICAVGQTLAAQDLCSSLRPYMKMHHVQTGVGHYGVFSGRKWEAGIYPLVREMIHMNG